MSAVVVLSAKLPMKILNVPTLLKPGMMQKQTLDQFTIQNPERKIIKDILLKSQNANTTNQPIRLITSPEILIGIFLPQQVCTSMSRTHNSEPQAQFLTTTKLFSVACFHERDKHAFPNKVTPPTFISMHFSLLFLPDLFPLWCNIHSTSYFPHPYFITWLPSKPCRQRNIFILVTLLYNIPFRLPNLKLQVLITSLRNLILSHMVCP